MKDYQKHIHADILFFHAFLDILQDIKTKRLLAKMKNKFKI